MTELGELQPVADVSMAAAERVVAPATGRIIGRTTMRGAVNAKPVSTVPVRESYLDVWDMGGVNARNEVGEYTL